MQLLHLSSHHQQLPRRLTQLSSPLQFPQHTCSGTAPQPPLFVFHHSLITRTPEVFCAHGNKLLTHLKYLTTHKQFCHATCTGMHRIVASDGLEKTSKISKITESHH